MAMITGSSRGLGLSLAEYFLERGYRVVGCSRSGSDFSHSHYHHTELDVSDEQSVRSWVRQTKRTFGRIDVLVCNAGVVRSALLLSMTPGDVMESFLKTNIAGVFYALREVSKIMSLQGSGRIISISSTMTALHEEGSSVYSASKSAVTEMTKILAKEIASTGVTCNVIAPAMMWTDSSEELSKDGDWKERLLDKQTIRRVITGEEVCHTVGFLVSPLSGGITGQVIYLGVVD